MMSDVRQAFLRQLASPTLWSLGALLPLIGLLLITGPGLNKSLFYVITALFCLRLIALPDTRAILHSRDIRLVAILTGYFAISHLWSGNLSPASMIRLIAGSLSLLVFLAIIAGNRADQGERYLAQIRHALVIAGVSAGLLALLAYAEAEEPREHFGRLLGYGQIHNPVVAGACYGMVTILALTSLLERRNWWWLPVFGLLLGLTVFTGARSALLAFVLAALALIWRPSGITGKAVLLLPLAVLASLLAWTASGLIERGFVRHEIWTGVLADTTPVTGLIGRGFDASFGITVDGVLFNHAHSLFVSTFFYGGIVGLALLTWVSLRAFGQAFRSNPTSRAVCVYGFTMMVLDGNRIVGDINFIWLMFWLPIGLLIGDRLAARASQV